MPSRTLRQQSNGHSVPHAYPANHCRAIVRVDGTGIRKKVKKNHARTLRDRDHPRRVLDQFHQTDQPQFTRCLKDDALEESANLPAPDVIAEDITVDLETALENFVVIAEDLRNLAFR